jgi:hypothetical protein
MGGTINLPTRQQWARHNRESTRQRLIVNLLLVKMGAFHRMLNSEFWVKRLDDAERALDSEWASTLVEPSLREPLNPECARDNQDPLNPVPTRVELMLWRSEAEAAFRIADKLNRGLTSDPKWVRLYPEVVAFSYEIRQRTGDVLTHIDQLVLELDIMRAYEQAEPGHDDGLRTRLCPAQSGVNGVNGRASRPLRRPSAVPRRQQRKGRARKCHDDALPKSPTIQ